MKVIQLFNNESQLIKKATAKNRVAQRQLFDKYAPKMLGVCRKYIKEQQGAEEAMQNGFVKVFLNLESFKNEGSFEGWIRKIMVRECISYLRVQPKTDFLEDSRGILPEISENISGELQAEAIQGIIDGLPEGYKLVFVMYAIEGYKHHEIAKMLDISEGTSKSQLFKARKMLQEKLTAKNKAYGTGKI